MNAFGILREEPRPEKGRAKSKRSAKVVKRSTKVVKRKTKTAKRKKR